MRGRKRLVIESDSEDESENEHLGDPHIQAVRVPLDKRDNIDLGWPSVEAEDVVTMVKERAIRTA